MHQHARIADRDRRQRRQRMLEETQIAHADRAQDQRRRQTSVVAKLADQRDQSLIADAHREIDRRALTAVKDQIGGDVR